MKKNIKTLCLFSLFSLLLSCASNLQNTKFYILPAQDTTNTETRTKSSSRIGVLPVNIPKYLQRSQIVLRENQSAQISIDEFNRWGEELATAFQRVIAIELANELTEASVMPLRMGFPVDYKLSIDVRSFEGEFTKNVHLDAYWILQKQSQTIASGHFIHNLPINSSYQELVARQSELIKLMAQDIAKVLKTLAQTDQ